MQPNGAIGAYNLQAYSLNNILIGRELLMLYRTTHEEKYRLRSKDSAAADCYSAADPLRRRLARQGYAGPDVAR